MHEELKKRDYIRKSEKFCEILRHRLEALNKESCWDEKFFTLMEAELLHIEVKKKKPIMQLSRKRYFAYFDWNFLLIVCSVFRDSITSSIYFRKVDSIAGILEELIMTIVILALIIGLSFWGIRSSIHYLKKVSWLKRQPDLRTMTRERLARNLEGLHSERSKKKYIEDLLYKKVELTGECLMAEGPGRRMTSWNTIWQN